MKTQKQLFTLAAALVISSSLVDGANAALIIDFSDSAGSIDVTYTGSLDTSGFGSTFGSVIISSDFSTGLNAGGWTWFNTGSITGEGNTNMAAVFVDDLLPVNDFTLFEFALTTTNQTGDALYLWAYNGGSEGGFATNAPYNSGDLISGGFELAGQTTAALGIVPTTWFTTTNGDDIIITVNSYNRIPTPSSLALFGFGVLAFSVLQRRVRKGVKTE